MMRHKNNSEFFALLHGLRCRWDEWRFLSARKVYYDYLAALLAGSDGVRTLKDIFHQDVMRYGAASRRGRISQHWLITYQRTGGDLYSTWERYFPHDELVLIRAAQSMGGQALTKTLRELTAVLQLLNQTTRILWGTLWPAALGMLLVVSMALAVPWYTLPQLMEAFAMVPSDYYGVLTRRLLIFSSFVDRHYLALLLLAIAAFWGLAWSLPNATGHWRRWVDRRLWWDVYRCIMALRFLSFLIIALGDDAVQSTQLREALLRQRSGVSPWLGQHIDLMLMHIDQGIVGPATFDTGLFSRDQFWFFSDMVLARGLIAGLILMRDRLREHILGAVARQAGVLRWLVLLSCVGFVLGLTLWHYAVIDEMRRAMSFYFFSQ